MHIEQIIRNYFQNLSQGDYHGIIELFAPDAIVISPLYGEKHAADFYKEVFSDTSQSRITLKNIFISTNQSNIAAAHFLYDWTLKDGTAAPFECIDVFEFDSNNKIVKLTIIYDTYQTRSKFDKLKS